MSAIHFETQLLRSGRSQTAGVPEQYLDAIPAKQNNKTDKLCKAFKGYHFGTLTHRHSWKSALKVLSNALC